MGVLSELGMLLAEYGVEQTTIRSVQIRLLQERGGSDMRVETILPETRNARRSLIQAGVTPRNARYKVPTKL